MSSRISRTFVDAGSTVLLRLTRAPVPAAMLTDPEGLPGPCSRGRALRLAVLIQPGCRAWRPGRSPRVASVGSVLTRNPAPRRGRGPRAAVAGPLVWSPWRPDFWAYADPPRTRTLLARSGARPTRRP